MLKIIPLYHTFDFISEVNCVLLGIGRKFENEQPSDFCLLLRFLRLTQDAELRRSRIVSRRFRSTVFFVSSTRNVHFLCINAINAHIPTFTICT